MMGYVMAWRMSVSIHIISSHFRVKRLKPTHVLMIIVNTQSLGHTYVPFSIECRRWAKFVHAMHQVKKEVCFFSLKQMWHVDLNSINKFLAHSLPLITQICFIEFAVGDLEQLKCKEMKDENILTIHKKNLCSTLDKHNNTAFCPSSRYGLIMKMAICAQALKSLPRND